MCARTLPYARRSNPVFHSALGLAKVRKTRGRSHSHSPLSSLQLSRGRVARHEIVSVACFPAKIIYALIYIKNAYASYFGGVRTDVDRTPDRALVGVECTDLEVPSGRVDEGVGKPACAHVAPCFASTLHAWACALHALAIGRWQCSGAPVALVGRA